MDVNGNENSSEIKRQINYDQNKVGIRTHDVGTARISNTKQQPEQWY